MGARLVLSARKADELQAATSKLIQSGIDAHWIAADAANPADVARLVTESRAQLGEIDILVNNAGASWGARPRIIRSKPGTK